MSRERTGDGEPIEFVSLQSHAHVTYKEMAVFNDSLRAIGEKPDERVFRRDCLELDFRIGTKPFTLYVAHMKSMGPGKEGVDGREWTMPVRQAESRAVRAIIERRFGKGQTGSQRFAICGDFNDYRERIIVTGTHPEEHNFALAAEKTAGFDPLLEDGFAVDLVQRRPAMNRWTLFHSRGPQEQHLCQLDYILASPALAASNAKAVPDIIRNGQPWRTPFPAGQQVERYPRIGWDRPKSSDHCPVAVSLNLI